MSTGEDIIKRVDALVQRLGLTSKEVAERAEMDPTALSKVRSGDRNLKASELRKLASALGVSPLALLDGESLSARLPIAPRVASDGAGGDAYRRVLALVELHDVLSRRGIRDTLPTTSVAAPDGPTTGAAVALGRRARQRLTFAEGPDKFRSIADAIEAEFGVNVLVEAYNGDTLAGAAVTDAEFPLIFVNADQPRQRALFTLAHELGHVLARHSGGVFWDEGGSFIGSTNQERAANAFAAEFLMPADEIGRLVAEFGRGATAIARMILTFGVSYESLSYRLRSAGFITAEGLQQLQELRWTGLIAAVSDDATRANLIALRSARPDRRTPLAFAQRLLHGFKDGVVSIRPLAGLLDCDPDELLEALTTSHETTETFNEDFSPSPSDAIAEDDLYAGAAA